MPSIQHNPAHRQKALARLIARFKDASALKTLIDIFAQQNQEIEDAFAYYHESLDLYASEHMVLMPIFAALAGQPVHDQIPASTLVRLISMRARAKYSAGTANDLIEIAQIGWGEHGTVVYSEPADQMLYPGYDWQIDIPEHVDAAGGFMPLPPGNFLYEAAPIFSLASPVGSKGVVTTTNENGTQYKYVEGKR